MSQAARFAPVAGPLLHVLVATIRSMLPAMSGLSVTEGICEYLRKQIASECVHYIPNFIDERRLSADDASSSQQQNETTRRYCCGLGRCTK